MCGMKANVLPCRGGGTALPCSVVQSSARVGPTAACRFGVICYP